MYDPTIPDPMNDRDVDFGAPEEPTALACDTCGSAMVLVGGNDECPLCDRIPSNNKPAALYQAGEHPVFSGGNWMARVAAEVDRCGLDGCVVHEVDETTARIEPETMAQTVSR